MSTRAQYDKEQIEVGHAFTPIRWIRPSDGDPDIVGFEPASPRGNRRQNLFIQGGGTLRGIVLHKLMEELVTGEFAAEVDVVRERARRLVDELSGAAAMPDVDLAELADSCLRTWSLPELVDYRTDLVAEVPIYDRLPGDDERLVAGPADAVCHQSGKPRTVFDWKSDVVPDSSARIGYP